MKRQILIVLSIAGLILAGLLVAAIVWVMRFQSLLDDEGEFTLTPSAADITYCSPDGVALQLDLYLPQEPAGGPWPTLVYVHGGSFTGGDKRKGSGLLDIPVVIKHGYAVAAVNYRLMPQHRYPAGLEDVKCAVRFLRAHGVQYRLLTDRIGLWGGSAGGYYAAMAGLTNDNAAYEKGEHLEQSSRVDVVVDMFGPTDLTAELDWLQTLLLRRAFGTDDASDPILRQASPVFQTPVAPVPPFLIIHGEDDSAVPVAQSRALYEKLQQDGAAVTLVIVQNANHNFKPTGGEISPTRREISEQMAAFFDQHLLADAK